MFRHSKHWMKHTAMVPKGFIRYQVLESLSQKPMSGSEIIDEIEKKTNGNWKPSPGSIYPLLAWLQDNKHVKELPTDQSGMKRYELTENGKALLEEQRKIMKDQRRMVEEHGRMPFGFRRGRMFGPPFMGALWFKLSPEKATEVRDTIRKLKDAFFEFARSLDEHFSEEAVDESLTVLKDTVKKLEEINLKMKEVEK